MQQEYQDQAESFVQFGMDDYGMMSMVLMMATEHTDDLG
jgi:hypothetical protein